jgi:hypothetical protein
MDDYNEHSTRRSVLVKDLTDVSEPLRGVVICCTSVPDEKRVSSPIYSKITRHYCSRAQELLLTSVICHRPNWLLLQSRWGRYTSMI